MKCLLVTASGTGIDFYNPDSADAPPYWRAVRIAVEGTPLEVVKATKLIHPVKTPKTVAEELGGSTVIVAELSDRDPVALFYLGFAKSLAKTLVTVCRHGGARMAPVTRLADFHFDYEASTQGIDELTGKLKGVFEAVVRAEELDRAVLTQESDEDRPIDWGRLTRVQHQNLCYEMLLRKEFDNLQWLQDTSEIDLLCTRSRGKDHQELFLVSIGGGLADEITVRLWLNDYKAIAPQVWALAREIEADDPTRPLVINALFIWSPQDPAFEVKEEFWFELKTLIGTVTQDAPVNLSGGIWYKDYLNTAVRQQPMIVRKYFADDWQQQTEQHKTTEDLYREAATLSQKAAEATFSLEKKYGVDPALEWQEKAYAVTHSIGNAIFPVETYLDHIQDMFAELEYEDGRTAAEKAKTSIEKAKLHIRKFKAIASLKTPELRDIEILPCIETSLINAASYGIRVDRYYEPDLPRVTADKDMAEELMDELVRNCVKWVGNQDDRRIAVTIRTAAPADVPPRLQSSNDRFLWLRIQDNGPGVKKELKEKIFELFFSRTPNGMGFGLAIVRKNMRGFGGEVVETGMPGMGAHFDLFFPIAINVS